MARSGKLNRNINSNKSLKRPRTVRRGSIAQTLLSPSCRTLSRKFSLPNRTVHTIGIVKGRRRSSIERIAGYKPGK